MRGFSAESLARAEECVTQRARDRQAERLGDELFAAAEVIHQQGALRRVLTDPSANGDAKEALVRAVFAGKVSQSTLDVLSTAVSGRWSSGRDLLDGLERLGVLAYVISADREGRVDDLEDELFRFGRLVAGDPRLRDALTHKQVPIQHRQALVSQLLDGKASSATTRLAVHAVASWGQSFENALESYQRVAADYQQRVLATVRTAIPLTSDEQERLSAALHRIYSRDVHLNVVVDPAMLGGIRVELGDDIIDGTVIARLHDARRKMTS